MNREIKFRVWNKENKIMSYSNSDINYDLINLAGKVGFIDFKSDFEPSNNCILMQYTGLKDKNGYEIYEEDIVNHKIGESIYKCIIDNLFCNLIIYSYRSLDKMNELDEMEIIGNIYENPELIKEIA